MNTTTTCIMAFVFTNVAGCASTPRTTVSYYLPRALTSISATQTLTCNPAKTHVAMVTLVDFATSYESDYDRPPLTFNPMSVDSAFSDSEIQLTLHNDGRLKSINTSSTGAGDPVVKSFASLVPLAFGGGALDKVVVLPICKTIADMVGDKPATISYKKTFVLSPKTFDDEIILQPDEATSALHKALPTLPKLRVGMSVPQAITPPVVALDDLNKQGALLLPKMALVKITVKSLNTVIATEQAQIAYGGTYTIPVPKAKFFGATKFNLALADSGTITAIGYTKFDGAAAALGSITAVHSAFTPTDAALAKKSADKADRIVEENRLAACLSDRTNCK